MRTRMRLSAWLVGAAAVGLTSVAAAGGRLQDSADAARRRLGYFTGEWRTDGEIRPDLRAPFAAFTSVDHGRWFDGEHFVVVEARSSSLNGVQVQLSVLGYDPVRHVYTFRSFNSRGIETAATGVFDGARWICESAAGQPALRVRHEITVVSDVEYRFQFAVANGDGPWLTFARGTAVKTSLR
ncbi:MAG: hypothetical protein IT184_12315 [Acidobacteria bacterium]|nr:hypothetical protein [Acidobacteriota bacterium]